MDDQNNQNPIIKEDSQAINEPVVIPSEPVIISQVQENQPVAQSEPFNLTQGEQDLPKEEFLPSDPVSQNSEEIQKAQNAYELIQRGFHKKMPAAIFHIEVGKIKPNPHQPRKEFDDDSLKELAASIHEFGILQPLVVSKIEKETEFGADVEYQLIAGERRLRASQLLGLERVPVIIRNVDSKSEHLEMAIVENLQRTNLNPVETARAYAKLQDEFGLTQREVAVRLGKSRETISNTMRLLNLPTEIQDAVGKGEINESQGRLLLAIDDIAQQRAVFQELLGKKLSVRELRSRIRGTVKQQTTDDIQQPKIIDPEIHSFQEQLAGLLGADVKIDPPREGDESETGKAGKIVITFYSPEEIQGIIEKLEPRGDLNKI